MVDLTNVSGGKDKDKEGHVNRKLGEPLNSELRRRKDAKRIKKGRRPKHAIKD